MPDEIRQHRGKVRIHLHAVKDHAITLEHDLLGIWKQTLFPQEIRRVQERRKLGMAGLNAKGLQ
jgi:hypothetical protein